MNRQDVIEAVQRASASRRDPISRVIGRVASAATRVQTLPTDQDPLYYWLSSSIAGFVAPGHPYLFALAVQQLPSDDAIVEIGTFFGASTNLIIHTLERHGRTNPVWNCDPWEYGERTEPITHDGLTFGGYREFAIAAFKLATETFHPDVLPRTLPVTSSELFERWRREETVEDLFGRQHKTGGPISFCYIDGEHDYANVRQDFTLCDEFLVPGGLILFDDSSPQWPDVLRLVKEVAASPNYEVVARNPEYLMRKLF